MTRVVLSVGSNLGDRLARLRSVADGLGDALIAASSIYEADPWGGVEQGQFLNAVLIADDPTCEPREWLRRAQEFERAAGRVRGQRWGPRNLDVDLIACYQTSATEALVEVTARENHLTLPHPLAHLRAFVLIPWIAVDPTAQLTVAGCPRPVTRLLAELEPADRDSVRLFRPSFDLNSRHPVSRAPES